MTGPEHYAEAEALAAKIADGAVDWEPIAALAQVHATLALAAATAMNDADGGMVPTDWNAWAKVASTRKPSGATP